MALKIKIGSVGYFVLAEKMEEAFFDEKLITLKLRYNKDLKNITEAFCDIEDEEKKEILSLNEWIDNKYDINNLIAMNSGRFAITIINLISEYLEFLIKALKKE